MGISSGSLNKLGSTLGSVTDALMKAQQFEAQQTAQKYKIDLKNKIVKDTIDYKNKLLASSTSPYIAEQEARNKLLQLSSKFSLDAKDILSTYKSFVSGEEITKNKKVISKNGGVLIVDVENKKTEYVPYPTEMLLYEETIDKFKEDTKDLLDILKTNDPKLDSNELLNLTSNPAKLQEYFVKNKEAAKAYEMYYQTKAFKDRADFFMSAGKSMTEANKLSLRENAPKIIEEAFNNVVSKLDKYKTPEDIISDFKNKLNVIKLKAPAEFNAIFGDTIEELSSQLKNMHPNTITTSLAKNMSDKVKIAKLKGDMIINSFRLNYLSDSDSLPKIAAVTELFPENSLFTITKLATLNGMQPGDFMKDVLGVVMLGNPALQDIKASYKTNAGDLINKITKVDFKNNEAEVPKDFVEYLNLFTSEHSKLSPQDNLKLIFYTEFMMQNSKKVVPKLIELKDNLNKEDPNYNKKVLVLNKLIDTLNIQ